VAGQRHDVAGAAALIRRQIRLAHAHGEGGIVIEEERGDVVVVDGEQDIRFALIEPLADGLVALEHRSPYRIVEQFPITRKADGRRVGCGDCADYSGHGRHNRYVEQLNKIHMSKACIR
jgi:hypothetical protein